MNPKTCLRIAITAFLISAALTVRAAAGDPPPSSLDLGAAKPKPDTSSVLNPGGILPVGQSPMTKKATADTSPTVAPGVGSAIKSPLGTKGILGSPVTGGKPSSAAQDEPASSNDVVVKMPSNMKK